MSLRDLLSFAIQALRGQRLRTGLSLVGVAIGVMAVVLLTALGEGARRYVLGEFQSLGTNILIIMPGKTETTGAIPGMGGAPNDLTIGDVEALRRGIPAAKQVVPVSLGNDTISYGERSRQTMIVGSTPDFLEVRNLRMQQGQFLPDIDPERSASVVVLGRKLARELCRDENPVGQVVRVGDWRMRVIGIFDTEGEQLGLDLDQIAVIPVGSALRLFNRSSLFRVLIGGSNPEEIDAIQERALAILTERHDEEDVTCISQDSVTGALTSILRILTMALAGIAAISLTVAGIGIMNVMLVSVSERTGEIGLLRAVGTSRRQIVAVFIVESTALAALGGAIGLFLSWLATRFLR